MLSPDRPSRKGDWMQTFTGRQFWPLDPRPEEIDIIDIAHSLSMMCRYGGHTSRFYSVAEHSVLVSIKAKPMNALWGLLHDASEAYAVDIPRPLKRYLSGYAAIENSIMRAVCERFGLDPTPPAEIKEIDDRIIEDERRALMGVPAGNWGHRNPLGVAIVGLPPSQAERLFIEQFEALTQAVRHG